MTWHDWASIASIFMAGVFDAFATIKRDGVPSFADDFIARHPSLAKWYVGGNDKYDPSTIFTADYWHFLKFLLIYSYCASVAFQVWKYNGFWWALLFWFIIQGVEGTVFRTVYQWLFPLAPIGGFWSWVRSFNPFVNWHK